MPSDTYTLTIADAGVSTPADGSVTTVKIADYNVAIAGTGVTTAKIVDGAVTSAKILNGTIVADDLATDSVVTAKVANLNITTDKLAANAVTTAKITDASVTDVKLASNSVTNAKIANASVNGDKLAANAVTYGKFQTIPSNTILGNSTGATAIVESKTCNAFGFTFLASADVAAARGNLGLGLLAEQNSLSVATGGTGQTFYTIGDIIYASGVTSLSKLSSVATGNALISGGVGAIPSYGKIGLSTHVSGLLPITFGGTANDGSAVSALTFDTLKFKTVSPSSGALSEGQLRWNGVDKTLDLKMTGANVTQQVGQELLMRVHTATSITNGDVVYISGIGSGLPLVSKASSTDNNSKKTIAMATEDIASGSDGYVTLYGLVRGLDLATPFVAGQELWLGETAGSVTATEPSYPNNKVRVGFVISAELDTGSAYIAPKFYENGLVNGTGKIGYLTGSGGSVTQPILPTNVKTNGVTLNVTNGQITMNTGAIAGGGIASFILTNSKIESGDVLILNHVAVGTFGSYNLNARSANGSAIIDVTNTTNGALSEAIVIAFAVIKAVTA